MSDDDDWDFTVRCDDGTRRSVRTGQIVALSLNGFVALTSPIGGPIYVRPDQVCSISNVEEGRNSLHNQFLKDGKEKVCRVISVVSGAMYLIDDSAENMQELLGA